MATSLIQMGHHQQHEIIDYAHFRFLCNVLYILNGSTLTCLLQSQGYNCKLNVKI